MEHQSSIQTEDRFLRRRRQQQEFHLESKGHCFFCLNSNNGGQEGVEVPQQEKLQWSSPFTLHHIFAYLGVALGRDNFLHGFNIQIDLCPDCSKVVRKFQKLFLLREKIKMEMDFQIEQLKNTIAESNSDRERWSRYLDSWSDRKEPEAQGSGGGEGEAAEVDSYVYSCLLEDFRRRIKKNGKFYY